MATGLLLSGTIAALLTSVLPAQHQPSGGFEDPPPDKIVIKVATVNGSGCRRARRRSPSRRTTPPSP